MMLHFTHWELYQGLLFHRFKVLISYPRNNQKRELCRIWMLLIRWMESILGTYHFHSLEFFRTLLLIIGNSKKEMLSKDKMHSLIFLKRRNKLWKESFKMISKIKPRWKKLQIITVMEFMLKHSTKSKRKTKIHNHKLKWVK